MSLISRITTWVAGQTLKAADLNGEFNNIVNLLNNLDSDSTRWTNVDAGTFKRAGTTIIPILQVVQVTTNTGFSSTSNAYTTTSLTGSITPGSTSNKILILVTGTGLTTVAGNPLYVTLARGTTDLSGGLGFAEVKSAQIVPVSFMYLDAPSTTSSTTYNVRIKNNDNSTSVTFGDSNVTQVINFIELGF